MIVTQAHRDKKYEEVSESIRDIYAGSKTGRLFWKIFTDTHLDRALYDDFCHIGGDIILGLYTMNDIQKLIAERMKLPPITAQALEVNLRNALNELGIIETETKSTIATPLGKSSALPLINEKSSTQKIAVPSYQKPLTGVPRYQNTLPTPALPTTPTAPMPSVTPAPTPSSQPPASPRM